MPWSKDIPSGENQSDYFAVEDWGMAQAGHFAHRLCLRRGRLKLSLRHLSKPMYFGPVFRIHDPALTWAEPVWDSAQNNF
jgi:hypothetical protein